MGSEMCIRDRLNILMRRLQTQSKSLMAKTINILPDPEAINTRRPTKFESLHEAREGLELVLNQLTVYVMDLELDDNYYDMAVSNAEKELLFGMYYHEQSQRGPLINDLQDRGWQTGRKHSQHTLSITK